MNKPLVIQVEDDPNDIFLFDRAFRKSAIDAELRAFQDGEGLIAYLSTATRLPTLVLLDIKLPRKSGFEVLQWVRSHATTRRLPVVMLTSSAQPHDVCRAYDLGANGYLVKPMDIEETSRLLSAIHAYWLTANVCARGTEVPQPASTPG